MKAFIIVYSLLLFVIYGCDKSTYKPDNELSIMCLDYANNSTLPLPTSDYHLKVIRMNNSIPGNDDDREILINDTIRTTEPVKVDNLNFGRFIISAKKDTVSTITELIYKGGSIQIDLILNPFK